MAHGAGAMSDEELELIVCLANTKPVELVDLGQSFEALGELYTEFVHSKGYEPMAGNARLYLVDVRSGSIVASLKGLLDQASFLVDHLDVLAGFLANVNDLIKFFTVQETSKGADLTITRTEALRLSKVLEPVAKDGGAQIVFEIKGNTAPVTVNNIVVTSERANAIQNNVRRFLGPTVPENGNFEKEVLYLQQMRGDSKTSVGDRGVIEKFSMKPVKLYFMTPEVKDAILDQPENPFKMSYVVDGEVSTAKGEPALYKVTKVHDAIEREASSKSKKRSKRAQQRG
jgi:hypothetical protein